MAQEKTNLDAGRESERVLRAGGSWAGASSGRIGYEGGRRGVGPGVLLVAAWGGDLEEDIGDC